jgi:hypothetical protein
VLWLLLLLVPALVLLVTLILLRLNVLTAVGDAALIVSAA